MPSYLIINTYSTHHPTFEIDCMERFNKKSDFFSHTSESYRELIGTWAQTWNCQLGTHMFKFGILRKVYSLFFFEDEPNMT